MTRDRSSVSVCRAADCDGTRPWDRSNMIESVSDRRRNLTPFLSERR